MEKPALKPYPAYKPAAVPWLQQVPVHWDIAPGLSHLRFKQEKNTGMVEKQVLSLSYGRIVIKPKEKLTGLVPESFETYQIVGPGDIIVRATDLQNDRTSLRIGEVKDRGIITSAYLCLNVHSGMVPSFGYYLIHAYDLMKVLYGFGSGLRQNLDWKDFKRMPLAVPPPDEQHLIVRYLHALDAKVKRYIRTKRTLIARLQEQKQAIIQRAVTRGLDPNVKLKPSGVKWLGEVPEGWKTIRIKYLLREVDARSGTGKETLLSMRMHHGIVPFAEHFSHPPQGATMIGFKLVKPGQVVVNRMQAGNGLIFKSDLTGLVSPDYAVFDCSPVVNVDFLMELFRSRMMRAKFRQESKGLGTGTSGFLRLYNDRLGAIHIALPPIAVQTTILVTLEAELQGLHTAIQRVENEINLMLEYHTRLIADVVTGAVDVSAAAKAMAVETEEVMEEEPLSMVAEGEAEYGESEE